MVVLGEQVALLRISIVGFDFQCGNDRTGEHLKLYWTGMVSYGEAKATNVMRGSLRIGLIECDSQTDRTLCLNRFGKTEYGDVSFSDLGTDCPPVLGMVVYRQADIPFLL